MQETVKNRELVSALADGQLRGEEFARTVEWVGIAADARLTWHAYHVVGDVLRSGEPVVSDGDAAFVRRLKLSLRQEVLPVPTVDATDLVADYAISTGSIGVNRSEDESANDTSFRWKLLAGFASLAAVSVIGWQVSGASGDQHGVSQLAMAPIQVPVPAVKPEVTLQQALVGGEPLIMIRNPQLDALLAAHQQFGGTSALQMPAGFLRNATFEGAAR